MEGSLAGAQWPSSLGLPRGWEVGPQGFHLTVGFLLQEGPEVMERSVDCLPASGSATACWTVGLHRRAGVPELLTGQGPGHRCVQTEDTRDLSDWDTLGWYRYYHGVSIN